VCALDGKKNSTLHYLADDGLAESWRADDTRSLFYRLLDAGASTVVNSRNKAGNTAIRLLLEDRGDRAFDRDQWYGHTRGRPGVVVRNEEEVDEKPFTRLHDAGVDWGERDEEAGKTLLHVVAASPIWRSAWRAEFLLEKGVDPRVCDASGKTPRDIAIENNNTKVIEVLDRFE
jgi:hypothetical protein